MGLADTFGVEDRAQVKMKDLYKMLKQAARAEIILEIARIDADEARGVLKDLAEKDDE